MNPAAQMIVEQQLSRYKADLSSWSHRVAAQRSALEAFRMAGHRPNPGSLISSLRHMANAERMQADRTVEGALKKHAETLDPHSPVFPIILRLAQGHWPSIYRQLDERRRVAGPKT